MSYQFLQQSSEEDKQVLKQMVELKQHYASYPMVVLKIDEMMKRFIEILEDEAKQENLEEIILGL